MDKGKLNTYLLSFKGVNRDYKEEWGWDRYLLNGKMIAAICKDKSGNEIINVKCEPIFGEALRNTYEDINPGYYMNKVHWNSVNLAGSVPDDVIKSMIFQSHQLILKGFSKKVQKELGG